MTFENINNDLLQLLHDGTHDKAMVIKALTTDLKTRTLTVLFNSSDEWNDFSQFEASQFIYRNCIKTVQNDADILGYQTFFCSINSDNTLKCSMYTEPQAARYFKTS